jgi:hypothetical protein
MADRSKIFVLKGNGANPIRLNKKIDEPTHFAYEQDAEGIKTKPKEIIPEYQAFNGTHPTAS